MLDRVITVRMVVLATIPRFPQGYGKLLVLIIYNTLPSDGYEAGFYTFLHTAVTEM